jgi:hypothetical protein
MLVLRYGNKRRFQNNTSQIKDHGLDTVGAELLNQCHMDDDDDNNNNNQQQQQE